MKTNDLYEDLSLFFSLAEDQDIESIITYVDTCEDPDQAKLGGAVIALVNFGHHEAAQNLLTSKASKDGDMHGNRYYAEFALMYNVLSASERDSLHKFFPAAEAKATRAELYSRLKKAIVCKTSFMKAYLHAADFCEESEESLQILKNAINLFPRYLPAKTKFLYKVRRRPDDLDYRLEVCNDILSSDATKEEKLKATQHLVEMHFYTENWAFLHDALLHCTEDQGFDVPQLNALIAISAYLSDKQPDAGKLSMGKEDSFICNLAKFVVRFETADTSKLTNLFDNCIFDFQILIARDEPERLNFPPFIDYMPIGIFQSVLTTFIERRSLQDHPNASSFMVYSSIKSDRGQYALSFEEYQHYKSQFIHVWLYQSKLNDIVISMIEEFHNPLLECCENLWRSYFSCFQDDEEFDTHDPIEYLESKDLEAMFVELFDWLSTIDDDALGVDFKYHLWRSILSAHSSQIFDLQSNNTALLYLKSIYVKHEASCLAEDEEDDLFDLAYIASLVGKKESAEAYYTKYLTYHPENSSANNNLAELYRKKGNMDAAYHHISIAYRTDPECEIVRRNYKAIHALYNEANFSHPYFSAKQGEASDESIELESLDTGSIHGLASILSALQENYSNQLISINASSGIVFPSEAMKNLYFERLLKSGAILIDRYSPKGSYRFADEKLDYNIDDLHWVVNCTSSSYPDRPLYDACKGILTKRFREDPENAVWIWNNLLAHELFSYTEGRFKVLGWELEYSHKTIEKMYSVLEFLPFTSAMNLIYGSVNRSYAFATEKRMNWKHAINYALKAIVTTIDRAKEGGWEFTAYNVRDEYTSAASEIFFSVLPEIVDKFYESRPSALLIGELDEKVE